MLISCYYTSILLCFLHFLSAKCRPQCFRYSTKDINTGRYYFNSRHMLEKREIFSYPPDTPNLEKFNLPTDVLRNFNWWEQTLPPPRVNMTENFQRNSELKKHEPLAIRSENSGISLAANIIKLGVCSKEGPDGQMRYPTKARNAPTNPCALQHQEKRGLPNTKKVYSYPSGYGFSDITTTYIIRYKGGKLPYTSGSFKNDQKLLKKCIEDRAGLVNSRAENLRRQLNQDSCYVEAMPNSGMVLIDGVRDRKLMEDILKDPEIDFIEKDIPVVTACQLFRKEGASRFYSWGLDRLDNKNSIKDLLDGRSDSRENTFNAMDYEDEKNANDTVAAYIIDTGIYEEHTDFQGRAKNIWSNWFDKRTDNNGHGTQVAGVIGGYWTGVSRKVLLYGMKAMPDYGLGSMSSVLRAMEYALRHHKQRKLANPRSPAKSIINISLVTSNESISLAAEEMIREVIKEGIPVVVAAGNYGTNAAYYSPARVPGAITVGSTNYKDEISPSSNYGRALDIFAPGEHIPTTTIPHRGLQRAPRPRGITNKIPDVSDVKTFLVTSVSGTSIASAAVTGVLATIMGATPGEMPPVYILENYMKYYSWRNVVNMSTVARNAGSPNALLASSLCSNANVRL